jgi:hypothetical protein
MSMVRPWISIREVLTPELCACAALIAIRIAAKPVPIGARRAARPLNTTWFDR